MKVTGSNSQCIAYTDNTSKEIAESTVNIDRRYKVSDICVSIARLSEQMQGILCSIC